MGSYMQVIVAKNIEIGKVDPRNHREPTTTEVILERVKELINLDLYTVKEDKQTVYLTLKDDIFRKNIKSFVMEQLRLFQDDEHRLENTEKVLSLIEADQLKDEDIDEYEFEKLDGGFVWISGMGERWTYLGGLSAYWQGICYLYEGKIDGEDYHKLITYLHRTIRLVSKNPLKDTVLLGIS